MNYARQKLMLILLLIMAIALLACAFDVKAYGILVDEWVEGRYRYCKYEVSPGEFRISIIEAKAMCQMDYRP